jgi:hypothetical protein
VAKVKDKITSKTMTTTKKTRIMMIMMGIAIHYDLRDSTEELFDLFVTAIVSMNFQSDIGLPVTRAGGLIWSFAQILGFRDLYRFGLESECT